MIYLNDNLENLPDVLFLDINMPRKNGVECLAEIKKNIKLKDLPVVMFSTTNGWDTINSLFNTGANVYIHKPGDFAQLKQVIQHALPIASEKATAHIHPNICKIMCRVATSGMCRSGLTS